MKLIHRLAILVILLEAAGCLKSEEYRAIGNLVTKGKLEEASAKYLRLMHSPDTSLKSILPFIKPIPVQAALDYIYCRQLMTVAQKPERQIELLLEHSEMLEKLAHQFPYEHRFQKAVAEYHLQIGWLYMKTHDLTKAAEQFLVASRVAPDIPDSYCYLGIVNNLMGNDNAAEGYYEQTLRIDRKNMQARLGLENLVTR